MASEENREEAEDVEAHLYAERPPIVADEQADEEPDVEAHAAAPANVSDQVADNVSD